MILTVLLVSLGLCAILFAIAHDIRIFRERLETAYEYAKNIVPDYLDNEKDFIYEKFLPTIASWKPEHALLAKAVSLGFFITLFTTLFTTIVVVVTGNQDPRFVFFVLAADVGIIGTYFTVFRPHKTLLYSKMNEYDIEITKIQEAAH